jgi:hypothetical protein
MLPKPGKSQHQCRIISANYTVTDHVEVVWKLISERRKLTVEKYELVPSHQFGFRSKHSAIDQVHRVTDVTEKSLEQKQVCSAIFLDIAQAFDRVWHDGLDGLLHKLKSILPIQYYQLFKSYLNE